MSAEIEKLTVDIDRVLLVALMTSTVAVLNDKSVPVAVEWVLCSISSENIVVVIWLFPVV